MKAWLYIAFVWFGYVTSLLLGLAIQRDVWAKSNSMWPPESAPAKAHAGKDCPTVASVTGVWITDHPSTDHPCTDQPLQPRKNPNELRFGDKLEPDTCVFGSSGSIVLLFSNNNLHPYACEKPSRDARCLGRASELCSVRITRDPPPGPGLLERGGSVLSALATLITSSPDKYIVAVSRGLEADLKESVVPLRGSQLDLSSAFKGMSAGVYRVRLAPPASVGKPSQSSELHYSPGTPALVPAAGLLPALYELLVVDETAEPTGPEAWVLIRGPEDYARVSAEFQDFVGASEKWPEDMDPGAVRALLRAYLDYLGKVSAPK